MMELKCPACGAPLGFVCKECENEIELPSIECDICGSEEVELRAYMSDEDVDEYNRKIDEEVAARARGEVVETPPRTVRVTWAQYEASLARILRELLPAGAKRDWDKMRELTKALDTLVGLFETATAE